MPLLLYFLQLCSISMNAKDFPERPQNRNPTPRSKHHTRKERRQCITYPFLCRCILKREYYVAECADDGEEEIHQEELMYLAGQSIRLPEDSGDIAEVHARP